MKTKDCRIKKLQMLGIDFIDVKNIVKEKYDYEVEETKFEDFMKHISEYDDIDELELLGILENQSYKKLSILSMRKLKKEPHFPICEEILNPIFFEIFKNKNDIGLLNEKEYDGELDECYKVVSFKELKENNSIKSLDIKIACVRDVINKVSGENGEIDDVINKIYDCARFFIDIDNKLIYMFYNDWPSGYSGDLNGYTEKKKCLYNMFKSATKGNIFGYVLSDSLTSYYVDYYNETLNGKSRKVISHIESMRDDEKIKAIKSTDYEYKHERKTLDAIKHVIDNKEYHISVLECLIADKLVRIKEDGSINIADNGICKEVLEYVCKEFVGKSTIFD